MMISFVRDSKDDILMGKSVAVYFKAIDFPDEDACERYLKAYDTRSEDVTLNEDGMRVLVDCYKYRKDLLFMEITPLTIKGHPLPMELLRKYKRGNVKVRKL